MALRVGALLRAAQELAPKRFASWVESDLPFGLDAARRLIAISKAYERLDPSVLEKLPRPWQALYALRKLTSAQLALGVSQGLIGPTTTIKEAVAFAGGGNPDRTRHHRADLAAGALMDCSVDDLHPMVLRALLGWLHGGGVRPLAVDVLRSDASATGFLEMGSPREVLSGVTSSQ